MKIAIVGYDIEGRASYDYFAAQAGHQIEIRDQKTDIEIPADASSVLGDGYLDNLSQFDLVVRTAGLHPRLILEKNPEAADKITTHLDEFFKVTPTKNIIGVTGSKGKGTTTSLIAKMLEADGKTVKIGGNIGVPPLSFLSELNPDSWAVLELSSFQLINIKQAPHIAACLMVVPEHLDWHADREEYERAKAQLFSVQTAADIAIYFAQNAVSKQIADHSPGQKIPYYAAPGAQVRDGNICIGDTVVCPTSNLKLLGEHNWQNVCAAVTAFWQTSQNVEAVRSVLTSFAGLEHRLELVREVNGVKYYNDSFGTTPETAIVALQAFAEPKVVILGGSDKGASYTELAQTVTNSNVRAAILIGNQSKRIQEALQDAGFEAFTDGVNTMSEIVTTARGIAQPGDVVLLSTACASFDMFKDYKDRGEQFKAAVQALA